MELPEEGTFVVLITTNGTRATGVVTHDPCHRRMVRYLDAQGLGGNAYKRHIKNFAVIDTNWEEGENA